MQRTGMETESGTARVVVLLSGSGRTLQNLIESVRTRECPIHIARVVSTRRNVAGNQIAIDAGIPLSVVSRRELDHDEAFSGAIVDILDSEETELVICAGFLSKLTVPARYMGRIVNIHPSLLPLFGGKGFYGDRVHRAVLESGMKVSGCTVHFVDNAYDAGPIIAQRCVSVFPDDSIETLAQRVFVEECRLYPAVISEIVQGRIRMKGRRAVYSPDGKSERSGEW
ncbi:MAG: phosphoribosylglycinamide formyltransferase [Thermomicrobiaceae bacterium]